VFKTLFDTAPVIGSGTPQGSVGPFDMNAMGGGIREYFEGPKKDGEQHAQRRRCDRGLESSNRSA
jgi:hypothetical protein